MNKNIFKILFVALILTLTFGMCAEASTSDEIMNDYYYRIYGSAYANFNNHYEAEKTDGDVDEKTASMTVNTDDYVINGKNGFTFPITRTFRSDTSAEYEYYEVDYSTSSKEPVYYTEQYICSVDNEIISIRFYNEREIYEAGLSFEGDMYDNEHYEYYRNIESEGTGIYYTKCYPDNVPSLIYDDKGFARTESSLFKDKAFLKLENGWKIPKASMIIYDYYHEADEWEVYEIFQDIYGNSTSFYFRYDEDTNVTRLESIDCTNEISSCNYTVSAVNNDNIDEEATHPLGFTYNFTITSDDGIVYYFDRTSYTGYNLICVSDKYGNNYRISQSTANGNEYYKITTDEGIIYKCTASGITKTCGGVVTELVSYKTEIVNSESDTSEQYTIDDEYIFSVIKNSGTSNTISNDEKNVTKYYMCQEYNYDKILSSEDYIIYKLPYKIVMPTGLERHFEYSAILNWVIGEPGGIAYGTYYSVSRCYDLSGTAIRKDRNFTFETERIPYQAYYYFSTATENQVNGSTTFRTYYSEFDDKSRLITHETRNSSNSYDKYTYEYKSDHVDAPIKSETFEKFISGQSIATHTKNYEYVKAYPTKVTDGDYVCDYTYYEDNYYIPQSVIYTKDANTTVKTENILTVDGKSIATQNVYENDVLKSTVHYTYDSYGNVASKTVPIDDTNSAVTTYAYTYNSDGGYTLITTQSGIVDADGAAQSDIVTSVTYDSQNNIISRVDANGNTTTMTYDLLSRPLSVSHPDGTSESYSYDMANNITTYTDQSGLVHKMYFDKWGNKTKLCTVPGSKELTYEKYSYDVFGRMSNYYRYTDSTNYTRVYYSYDYLNRPLYEYIYKNSGSLLKKTAFAYTHDSDVNSYPVDTTTITVTGDTGTYAKYSETTDYRGNVIEKKYFTDDETRTYTYTYDYVGNLLTETNPAGQVTTTAYDYLNRPVSVTNADGKTKIYEYNALDLLSRESDFMGNFSSYTYDNAGRLLTQSSPFNDEGNSLTKMYYDPNGNVTQTHVKNSASDSTDETFEVTDNAYDSMNRLKYTAVHPDEETTIYNEYRYNSLGKPTYIISGLTEPTNGGSIPNTASYFQYQYSLLGYPLYGYDPEGGVEQYGYDYAGRMTEWIRCSDRSDETRYISYTYDNFDNLISKASENEEGNTDTLSYTYNIMGQRTSMTDSTGTTTYTYNPFGELTTETKGDIIKSYTYDNISNRTGFSLTNDDTSLMNVSYAYDNLNRLISVNDGTDVTSYTYDANSNELSAALNGTVYKSSVYNLANKPTTVYYPNSGDDTNRLMYQYRLNGKMHSHTDWFDYDSARIYGYDGAGRLTAEVSMLDDVRFSKYYTYDTRGNISSVEHHDRSADTVTTTTYTYDRANKLLSSTDGTNTNTYAYDAIGNMTFVTKNDELIKSYSYDNFERLISSTVNGVSTAYTYDGDNLRQTKTTDSVTTQHILDGMNVVADVKGTNTTTFTRGNELLYSKNPATGERITYNNYSNGGTAQLVKPDGTFTEYTYDAYGGIVHNSTDNTNPFTYCGEYTDVETGLVYLRNRYYDPELGRFLTQDPIKDGLNWYAYCSGDPVNFVDPMGYVRAPGYVDGVWSDNPDAYEFGEDSLIYDSLVTLGKAWEIRPENRMDIEELANRVREVGRQFAIEKKLEIAENYAPESANSTDIVILAGDMDKAYFAGKDMEEANRYANELYGKDSDGSQHNALKHTMWNALMTKRYGADYARLVANSHEFGAKENLKTNSEQQELINMDLWNNSIGRNLGETFEKSHWYGDYNYELAWEIVKQIDNKVIWVINWVD